MLEVTIVCISCRSVSVSHLRHPGDRVAVVLALHSLHVDLEVQLTHPGDNGLLAERRKGKGGKEGRKEGRKGRKERKEGKEAERRRNGGGIAI